MSSDSWSLSFILALFVLSMFAAFIGCEDALGQDNQRMSHRGEAVDTRRTWVRLGFGIGSMGSDHLAADLSVNHQRGPHLFSLRGISVAGALDARRQMSDTGVVYSRGYPFEWGNASMGAGLAFVWGKDGNVATVGIPLQSEVYVAPLIDTIGISLAASANLNLEQSFAGITIGLVIGDLR